MQLSRTSSKLKESMSFGDNSPVLQVKKTRRQRLLGLLGELNRSSAPERSSRTDIPLHIQWPELDWQECFNFSPENFFLVLSSRLSSFWYPAELKAITKGWRIHLVVCNIQWGHQDGSLKSGKRGLTPLLLSRASASASCIPKRKVLEALLSHSFVSCPLTALQASSHGMSAGNCII